MLRCLFLQFGLFMLDNIHAAREKILRLLRQSGNSQRIFAVRASFFVFLANFFPVLFRAPGIIFEQSYLSAQ